MLPSSKRLTIPLFKNTLSKGKIFHSPLFTFRLQKTEGHSRFSVAISKKVAKTAVERNKLRRRAYSVLSELHSRIHKGFHGVLMAKPALTKATFTQISLDLEEIFGKIGILK